jgi:hypothetical protein
MNEYAPAATPPSGGDRPLEVERISMLIWRGTGGRGRRGMTTVGSWRFGERVDCGGRLDGGLEVGRRGIFGIVVRYRRLSHT